MKSGTIDSVGVEYAMGCCGEIGHVKGALIHSMRHMEGG